MSDGAADGRAIVNSGGLRLASASKHGTATSWKYGVLVGGAGARWGRHLGGQNWKRKKKEDTKEKENRKCDD